MVVINPGGGQQINGSDGLQSVFNGAADYEPPSNPGEAVPEDGSDQQFFANTGQWCCSTGSGPNINIGGQNNSLIGNINVAGRGDSSPYTPQNWTSVEIVSTSGSAVRAPAGSTSLPSTPTGDGTAVIRYTMVYNSLTYVLERAISYTYPNNFYTENYTMTIPAGNTDVVKLYLGGDAAPGDSDQGNGLMVTSPRRAIYEVNTSSGIYISYAEAPGGTPMEFWFVGNYSTPRTWYRAGQDLDNTVNSSFHDAGINAQWSFPTAAGSYSRQMTTGVGFQGTGIAASFSNPSITTAETSNLQIQLVNTLFSTASGLGFTYSLPAGLAIAGAATSDCGGTLTTSPGAASIDLSGASVAAASNCTVSVPVNGNTGTYSVNDQDFTVAGGLEKGYGVSNLTITSPSPPAPPAKFALSVTKSGAGSGTVSGSGIDCGAACSAELDKDTKATLTATPASGSRFAGWSGACSGTASTCEVTMSEARSVDARFEKVSSSFAFRGQPSTSGSVTTTRVTVPGPGRISQSGTRRSAGKTLSACKSVSRTVSRAGTYSVTCRQSEATRAARRKGAVRISLCVTYTPSGGAANRRCRAVVLASTKPKFTG